MRRIKRRCLHSLGAVACLALATACVPVPPAEPAPPAFDPSGFSGGQVYRIVPDDSRLMLRVYRAGPLARLGHNHIVSTRDIEGAVYRHNRPERSGVVLKLPVRSFVVDDPELRRAAGEGFESTLDPEAVAGTRRNMLGGKLLEADEYPDIHLVSVRLERDGGRYRALMRITVKDRAQDVWIPAAVEQENSRLRIAGSTSISHAQLGLEPFSIMMGAIRVKDEMDIDFELVAEQVRA